MLLSDVMKRLRLLAPLQLAEKWDNVGLLVESSAEKAVDKVLMANDLTSDVLNEAVQNRCQMIISYHPFIFKPLSRLTRLNWKERLVLDCIQSDISVFSPHTSWDAVSWMNNLNIIKCALGQPDMNLVDLLKSSSLQSLYPLSCEIKGKLILNRFSGDTFNESAEEIYQGLVKTAADEFAIVRSGAEENSMEVVSNYSLSKLANVKPLSVTELGTGTDHFGCGLKIQLPTPLRELDVINNIKHYLDLRYVRYCAGHQRTTESDVQSFAVCAGSGASVLKNVLGSVDLIITGEMSHHEVLDAKFNGTSVMLTEHSDSERKYLAEFKKVVENIRLLPNCDLIISQTDKDPLDVY